MKKHYLVLICMLLFLNADGQRNKIKPKNFNRPNKQADLFLQKQWWLGFKAGPNLSSARVLKVYQIVSPTNYNEKETAKKYKHFNLVGSQATFEVTFSFKEFSISLQPTYRHSRFIYENNYEWTDAENSNNRLILNYEQAQTIADFDIPLILKYEFRTDKLRPYVQSGIYQSYLLNANKSVTISGVDYASGGINTFENEAIIIGATDLFAKYHWGLGFGGGLNYSLGNIKLNLDFIYRLAMSNISATKNRYGSDQLSGVGDSLDDMKMNNLALSAGCLFPMRFLGSGFKAMDGK